MHAPKGFSIYKILRCKQLNQTPSALQSLSFCSSTMVVGAKASQSVPGLLFKTASQASTREGSLEAEPLEEEL